MRIKYFDIIIYNSYTERGCEPLRLLGGVILVGISGLEEELNRTKLKLRSMQNINSIIKLIIGKLSSSEDTDRALEDAFHTITRRRFGKN